MPGNRRVRLVSRALELLPDGTLLERMCGATLPLLDVTGAVVALMSERGGGGIVARAGEGAEEVFDLQFRLGEGPCREAFDDAADVFVDDLAQTGSARWPIFTPEAVDAGAAAAFAVTARMGAIRIGMLYLQRDTPGPLSPSQAADLRTMAEICTALLLDHRAGLDLDETALERISDWPDRAVVHQATGMVAVQLDSDLGAALARLRAYAFTNDMDLHVVAADVVGRGLRFAP